MDLLIDRVRWAIATMLSDCIEYHATKRELEKLDRFALRDLGISQTDFESIARRRYCR